MLSRHVLEQSAMILFLIHLAAVQLLLHTLTRSCATAEGPRKRDMIYPLPFEISSTSVQLRIYDD